MAEVKEIILKAAKEEKITNHMEKKPNKIISKIFSRNFTNLQVIVQWQDILKVLKGKNLQPRIINSVQ